MHIIGTKATIIRKIYTEDSIFMSNLNRALIGVHKELIDSHFNAILTSPQLGRFVQCTINGKPVTKNMIRQFSIGSDLDSACIDTMLELFRLRDKRIVTAHHSVNKDRNHYIRIPQNLFCSPGLMQSLTENQSADINSYFSEDFNIDEYNLAFIPWQIKNDGLNFWSLIVIDVKKRSVYVFSYDLQNNTILAVVTAQMERIDVLLQPILVKLFPAIAIINLPKCCVYPYSYSEVVLEETNSGVMILATIYYIVRGCPVVHINSDLLRLRYKFPYWFLLGALPQ